MVLTFGSVVKTLQTMYVVTTLMKADEQHFPLVVYL